MPKLEQFFFLIALGWMSNCYNQNNYNKKLSGFWHAKFWHTQVLACPGFGWARLVLNQLGSSCLSRSQQKLNNIVTVEEEFDEVQKKALEEAALEYRWIAMQSFSKIKRCDAIQKTLFPKLNDQLNQVHIISANSCSSNIFCSLNLKSRCFFSKTVEEYPIV
jgi:hypothetical protein